MNTGVYVIRNFFGGEEYVGSAMQGFSRRWSEHIRHLKKGDHTNWFLQAAWNHFGHNALQFSILERCPKEDCLRKEQKWMNALKPEYNILKYAGAPGLGRVQSAQERAQRSIRSTGAGNSFFGKKHTPETLARLSIVHRGRVTTPETKMKLSEASKRVQDNPEYRARMAATIKAWWAAGRPSHQKHSTP